MKDIHKKLESLTNVAIIVIAILFGTVLVSKYVLSDHAAATPKLNGIAANKKFNLREIDWSKSEKNLVVAFSTNCRFCIESTAFYEQMANRKAERSKVRLIVVSPQPVDEVQRFFRERRITIDEFVQAPLSDISVNGTPTLVLVDREGLVKDSWVGKLPPDVEKALLSKLFDDQGWS